MPESSPAQAASRALQQAGSKGERLQAVRGPCLACVACDLAKTRTQVVFGEGNINSPLVIVGEGPGEQEDASGRPFVGRAGVLLEKALRENGILRQHVYITNVLKCRACLVEGRRLRNRPPREDEASACRPWLEAELTLNAPLVILCLGGPSASWVIHPGFKILKERGQWFSTPWAQAAMATLHPAYVLRQEGPGYESAWSTLVRDIGEARRKVLELKKGAAVSAPAAPDPAVSPDPASTQQAAPPAAHSDEVSVAEPPEPRQGALPF